MRVTGSKEEVTMKTSVSTCRDFRKSVGYPYGELRRPYVRGARRRSISPNCAT